MATAPPLGDAVLVRRLRERDRTAWEEVYADYGRRLHGFAYRLTGSEHDAADLVQETFVRTLPRLDKLDPDRVELGPYLFTTLRNLFLKSVERRRRQDPVADVPEPDGPAPIEDDPARSTLLQSQQREVRVANARLAPRQRLVLALRELEDKSYAEIGAIVGLNENAVAQLISRARESLRTELRLAQVDPARLPEACRSFLPLLSAHLDGQLKGPKLEATLTHLEACPTCQEALDSMREAQRRYRSLLPPALTAFELFRSVDDALAATGYWDGPRRPLLSRRTRLATMAVAAGLAGLLGVGGGVAVYERSRPQALNYAAVVAPTETVETTEEQLEPEPEPAPSPEPPGSTSASKPKHTNAKNPDPNTSPAPKPEAETEETVGTTGELRPPRRPDRPDPPPPPRPRDRTPPQVTIVSRPDAVTRSTEARFYFAANETGVTFACSLDGGAFAYCTNPAHYKALAGGTHSFGVRAADASGNTSTASAQWTIDVQAPSVTIASAPDGTTTSTSASFTFSSNEPGSTFQCSLDGGAYEGCASPKTYGDIAAGTHTFAVRAIDAVGNTGGPASHSWTVVVPLPDLVVSQLTSSSVTVTNVGNATAGASILTVTLIGSFTIPPLAPGQSITRTWSVCRVGTLTAVADRQNAVAESNEGNNTASRRNTCSVP